MRVIVITLAAFVAAGVSQLRAAEPTDVGMVQLLAQPEKYHGKFIRVHGFLRLEFEGKALYLHREDYANGLTKNGVWVDMLETPEHMKLNMHYVLIEGVFNAKDRGHLGLWSGAIEKINRSIPSK